MSSPLVFPVNPALPGLSAVSKASTPKALTPKALRMPSYRLHKASGQGVVTIGGRDVYLGAHGTEASHAEYRRVLAEWLAVGNVPNAAGARKSAPGVTIAPGSEGEGNITIGQLLMAFWRHAERAYPASSSNALKRSLRRLRVPYGHTLVRDFKPLGLRAIQQETVDAKDDAGIPVYCRRTINHYCADLRHVFEWGVGEGLVPGMV